MQRELIYLLAEEVARVCPGQTWERVLPRPGEGLALLPGDGEGPALDLSPLPARGWVAATTTRLRADKAPGGSGRATLARELSGHHLKKVELLDGDRVVRLILEDQRSLVVELMGAAGNIYLLESDDTIVCALRSVHRPGGRLVIGESWQAPGRAGEEVPATALWVTVAPGDLLQAGLATSIPTREIDPLDAASTTSVEVLTSGASADTIFEPSRLLGDAVLRRAWLRERHTSAATRLAAWQRRLRGERSRLKRLDASMAREQEKAAGHASLRRHAECLAAGLGQAQRKGQSVRVPDLYGLPGAELEVVLKPGERPPQAMERLFRQAGRRQRGEAKVVEKLEAAQKQRRQVEELLQAAQEIHCFDDLELAESGAPAWLRTTARGTRPTGGAERANRKPRDPRERKVRRYVLPGDWHLVVGGEAAVNDFVSFRLSSPRDFWLHVADYPGAHVLLRNPRRLDDPPMDVLHQAAAVAVWFSKAKGKGPVEVRWTQARYLRKGKGLPPGTVLLPSASTVTAEGVAPPRGEARSDA